MKYQDLGSQLLDDPTGVKVDSMEHKHGRDSLRINTEILKEWLKGQGRRPVSWRTLIAQLLYDNNLPINNYILIFGVRTVVSSDHP